MAALDAVSARVGKGAAEEARDGVAAGSSFGWLAMGMGEAGGAGRAAGCKGQGGSRAAARAALSVRGTVSGLRMMTLHLTELSCQLVIHVLHEPGETPPGQHP